MGVVACGQTNGDRALSGGAVVGALDGSPLTGALIGGAAGAATGALTDESDIRLGDPIWD